MPMPRAVARFNRYPNRIVSRIARHIPPLLLLTHTGRTSGKEYQTPVCGFRTDAGFIIALTYGREADWVRNVLAAGGCDVEYRNRRLTLTDPTLVVTDPHEQPHEQPLPGAIKRALGLLRVRDFLTLRVARPD